MNIKERNDVKPEARNAIVRTLIEAGCNPNYKHPKSKLSPLHWAAKARKDPETVKVSGSQPDIACKWSQTRPQRPQ